MGKAGLCCRLHALCHVQHCHRFLLQHLLTESSDCKYVSCYTMYFKAKSKANCENKSLQKFAQEPFVKVLGPENFSLHSSPDSIRCPDCMRCPIYIRGVS